MKAQFGRGKPLSPPQVWRCCSMSMHVSFCRGYRSFLCSKLACQKCPKFFQKFVRGVCASALVVRSQILTSSYNPNTSPCITAFGSEKFTKSSQKGAYARNVMFRDANGRLNRLIQGRCALWRSSLAVSSNRTSRIFSISNDFCGS
jgi:hypothetical protein